MHNYGVGDMRRLGGGTSKGRSVGSVRVSRSEVSVRPYSGNEDSGLTSTASEP